jgi:short-subunit dehydrogenase
MSFALITGASKGIGRAIAKEFAVRKINLLLIARSEELLSQLSEELKRSFNIEVHYLVADLGQPHAAKKIFDWCTEKNFSVNILVNNAGYGLSGAFDEYPADKHIDMMIVNMMTPVTLISLFLPHLKKHNKSYILNIGSSSAYQAVPYMGVYSASKSFIVSFTRALKYELKDSNVVVTLVSPGVTASNFNTTAKIPEKGLKAAERIAMTPEEVAKIAVKSLFKGKTEVIVGFLTKLTVFMVGLMPKKLTEKIGSKFYKS